MKRGAILLLAVGLVSGMAANANAAELDLVSVGVVGAVPFDSPGGTVGAKRPVMAGVELEAAIKETLYSYKLQWRTGTVGGGLTATEYNLFFQKSFFSNDTYNPYAGLGLTVLNVQGLDGGGLGAIVGVDYNLSKSLKAGVFGNTFRHAKAGAVYNYFVGFNLDYRFAR